MVDPPSASPVAPAPIEDYALIGDCATAALVSRQGSVDWLCLPRFDSGACFAALLGSSEHGRWLLAPVGEPGRLSRRYCPDTLVLETRFATADGEVTVVDCMPLVGFLPPSDPRVRGTVRAIQQRLVRDGFVMRYSSPATPGYTQAVDGLPPGEGVFLMCTFWLADNLILLGQRAEAQGLFGRLLALRNDVGLLSEEYDPGLRRLLGNFPQAFSHVALINTAHNLAQSVGPAEHRST